MGVIAFLLVVWILKNAAMDVTCAVKGIPNPRYEAKKVAAAAAGKQPKAQPHYGTREYWADFKSDYLARKTEIRRERLNQERRQRATDDAWLLDAIDEHATAGRPAVAPESVVATPPRRRPEPDPKAAPLVEPLLPPTSAAPVPAPAPAAKVVPFRLHVVPPLKEPIMSAVASGEVTGLTPSIAYAHSLTTFAGEHAPAGNEGYIGHLTASKVRGAGLSSAHAMQEAFENAAAAAARHAAELEKQLAVQEAYDSNPDAGDKNYMQQGR